MVCYALRGKCLAHCVFIRYRYHGFYDLLRLYPNSYFWKEKIQGVFCVGTALVPVYLYSVFGVQRDPNDTKMIVGICRAIALGFEVLIESFGLVFGGLSGGE